MGRNARIVKQIANGTRAPVRARYTILLYSTNIYLGAKDSLALEVTSVQDAGTSNRKADETDRHYHCKAHTCPAATSSIPVDFTPTSLLE